MIDVNIVIVTYNSSEDIEKCLESCRNQVNINYRVTVVDNNSSDRTVGIIKDKFHEVMVIVNKFNNGFGSANNQGARIFDSKYIHLLNPDAMLSEKNTLDIMMRYMEIKHNCGILGSPVYENGGTTEAGIQHRYPLQKYCKKTDFNLPGEIAFILGANMFIRKKKFDSLGGFDEGFFLYYEEVDLCFRMRRLGVTIDQIRLCPVYHIGGASEKSTTQYQYTLKKQNSLNFFIRKNYYPSDAKRVEKIQLYRARFRKSLNYLMFTITRKQKNLIKFQHYKAVSDSISVLK